MPTKDSKPKKSQHKPEKKSSDYIDLVSSGAGSSGDMTGLIPAAPKAGQEIDAYRELYGHTSKTRREGGEHKL